VGFVKINTNDNLQNLWRAVVRNMRNVLSQMEFVLQRFKESLLVDPSASLRVLLSLDVTCNLGILSEFLTTKVKKTTQV
jgi:hypothetical protein